MLRIFNILAAPFSEAARDRLRTDVLSEYAAKKYEKGFLAFLLPAINYAPGNEENLRHVKAIVNAMLESLGPENTLRILASSTSDLPKNKNLRDVNSGFYTFLTDSLLATADKIESPDKKIEGLKEAISYFPSAIMTDSWGGYTIVPDYLRLFDATLDSVATFANTNPGQAARHYYELLGKTVYSSRTGDVGSQRKVHPEQTKRVLIGLNDMLAQIEPKSFLSFLVANTGSYRLPKTNDGSVWNDDNYKTLQFKLGDFITRVVSVDRAAHNKDGHTYRDFTTTHVYSHEYGSEYLRAIQEGIKQIRYPVNDKKTSEFNIKSARDKAADYIQLSLSSHHTREAVVSALQAGASLDLSRSILKNFGPDFLTHVFQNPDFMPVPTRDYIPELRQGMPI